MTTRYKLTGHAVLLAIATLSVPARVHAQTALALTLEDAVQRAKAEAPRVAEARARMAAAEATVSVRESLKSPTATATTGYLRTNHVPNFGVISPSGEPNVIFHDIPNNYRVRGELNIPVYSWGRIDALVSSAQADSRAADADRRTVEADIAFETARAYWTLALARAEAGVLEQALQRADAQVADVRARVDAGVLPPNDLLSSQARRARQNVRLIQARNIAAAAEADLARLVGAEPGQPITLATPTDQPGAGPAGAAASAAAGQDLTALVTRARGARPERDALAARQAALTATGDAAIAATRPQIGAVAAVEPSNPNRRWVPPLAEWNTGWDVGVTLTWNVFDGGRARAERAGATAQADALGHRLADFDQLLALDLRQRLLDIESHRAALAAAGEAVEAATEARRVVEQRFAAGVATSTDVLDAQQTLLESEMERTRLQVSLRLDEARLLRSLGGA